MKKITFQISLNLMYLRGLPKEDIEKYIEIEKARVELRNKEAKEELTDLESEKLEEIDDKLSEFQDIALEIDPLYDISYIPKSSIIDILIEDTETNSKQKLEVFFEKPEESVYKNSSIIQPVQKFEFPYDVKIGTYFIEYEKAWGTVYLERDDFDISKLEVKEYFHKQNDDNAVLVSYDGVDLLKNIEIEAGKGSRFFTTTID